MDQAFWNTRYTEHQNVYGVAPNLFFKQFIDAHQPGTLLLPAEGEGRNAVYAASNGWEVDAFDFSDVARERALQRAEEKGVCINYELRDLAQYYAEKQYDAVALLYVHLPEEKRRLFHKEMIQAVKPGGYLVLEAFAREQINYTSGGPKDVALLYEASSVCIDFQQLHLLSCCQKEVELNEGPFHTGKAVVVQLIGQKLS